MANTAKKQAKLEELTPEQEALMGEVAREAIDAILVNPREPDMAVIRRWLEVVYGLYDRKVPERIEIVGSPFAALALAKELTGKAETSLDWTGVADAGWVSFYDYFRRIGVLSEDEEECRQTMALRDFQRCAWDSLLLDECAIVVALPRVKVDEDGNLHCSDGPSVSWPDGQKDHSWHGVWVPERIVTAPRSYTREEYLAITDTEIRRALGESAGWAHVVELLGAKVLDEWRDEATGLEYALLGTDTERWIRKQSPVLQTDKQPVYFEPVHENLRTARAARKWQAARLSPEECERDPELRYGIET
jgi:hypothetical protein